MRNATATRSKLRRRARLHRSGHAPQSGSAGIYRLSVLTFRVHPLSPAGDYDAGAMRPAGRSAPCVALAAGEYRHGSVNGIAGDVARGRIGTALHLKRTDIAIAINPSPSPSATLRYLRFHSSIRRDSLYTANGIPIIITSKNKYGICDHFGALAI